MKGFWEQFELEARMELLRAYVDSVEDFLETEQKKLVEESKKLASKRQGLEGNKDGEVDKDWEQLRWDELAFEAHV
jgi:hypothetical protein